MVSRCCKKDVKLEGTADYMYYVCNHCFRRCGLVEKDDDTEMGNNHKDRSGINPTHESARRLARLPRKRHSYTAEFSGLVCS